MMKMIIMDGNFIWLNQGNSGIYTRVIYEFMQMIISGDRKEGP